MSASVTHLALRVADVARGLGFTSVRVTVSRNPASASRYVRVDDRGGREWEVRVSDHCRSPSGALTIPHYDLIARPAEVDQAVDAVSTWLAGVAAGLIAWHDPVIRQRARRHG